MEDVVVGKVFTGKSEVLSSFEEYFQQTYQPFIRHVTSSKQIVFRCSHWRQRKSQGSGRRPNQHYLFTGCNAHINLYKGKDNCWKVTLVELKHNHPIGKEEYSVYRRRTKLTYQDYKLISDLLQAKVKDSAVADIVKAKREKFLTRKDITNIRYKLCTLNSEEKERHLRNQYSDCSFHDKHLQEEKNDANAVVKLEDESVKGTTPEKISYDLNPSNLKNESNKMKTLTESEKYKIALEFFTMRAKILSKLGSEEFLDHMEQLKNCKNCSCDDPGPGSEA